MTQRSCRKLGRTSAAASGFLGGCVRKMAGKKYLKKNTLKNILDPR